MVVSCTNAADVPGLDGRELREGGLVRERQALEERVADDQFGGTMAGELLAEGAKREARQLDEKLYLEVFAVPPPAAAAKTAAGARRR